MSTPTEKLRNGVPASSHLTPWDIQKASTIDLLLHAFTFECENDAISDILETVEFELGCLIGESKDGSKLWSRLVRLEKRIEIVTELRRRELDERREVAQ